MLAMVLRYFVNGLEEKYVLRVNDFLKTTSWETSGFGLFFFLNKSTPTGTAKRIQIGWH